MRRPRLSFFGFMPFGCIAIAAFGALAGSVSAETPSQTDIESSRAAVGPENPNVTPARLPQFPPAPLQTPATRARAQPPAAEPARLPKSANTAAIEPATCSNEARAQGIPVVCGYVPVPLDWSHPGNPEKIKIFFELYTPARSGPTESAMLMNWGGPGFTTTGRRDYAFYSFGKNLDAHDLLLIDDRGRGYSGTIDCGSLQHGTKPFAQAEAECAAQLGMAASRYGTGDIAQDTDAVRAALGYDKVDYFGWSYGGVDVEAYATRFGNHLRSIVLDSPLGTPALYQFHPGHLRAQAEPNKVRKRSLSIVDDSPTGTPALDPFAFDYVRTRADLRMVLLDCLRSPTCAPDHPLPDIELDALVSTICSNPVEGDSHDASGNKMHVKIDEGALVGYVIDNPTGNFTSTGELLAAAGALRRGDPVPLLRLGAEGYLTRVGEGGDPTFWSYGATQATWSADFDFPWDWSAPVSTRQKQYDAAVAALPSRHFEPFSKEAVTALLFDSVSPSLWWEMPTPPSPIALPNANYPHVPTLVISGDMDTSVPLEITRKVASLYPDSVFVQVAEAGHTAIRWSQCAAGLASEFIRTLKVGDTRCAATPETVWPAVGRFPLFARDAVPAEVDETGGNEIGTDERMVVTVAVATAIDAMQRRLLGSGTGVGLRGGTFHRRPGDSTTWTVYLTNCAFTEDVTVSGTATWSPGSSRWLLGFTGDSSFKADLTVAGAGTQGGTLHVEGKWLAPGPVGKFKVTGTLGGKNVAVLVPEA